MKVERGKRVEHKVVEFPAGFSQLPWPGGMADQPVWTMTMFDQFVTGERAAAYKRLNSKS